MRIGHLVALVSALATVVATAPPGAVALEGEYESVSTRIGVKLTARVSSQDAVVGDRFTFDTTSSVQLEGRFLPAGTHGHGEVVAVRAGRGPQPGLLTLEARSLDLESGPPVAVGLPPGQLAITLKGDRRSLPAAGAGGVPILLGGTRATNVTYEKGTLFTVVAPPPATPEPAPAGTDAP